MIVAEYVEALVPILVGIGGGEMVDEEIALWRRRLLTQFKALTGCPVLLNTSFNVRGEPIVCTPQDAFRCFMGNELDLLVVGNCVLRKSEQNSALKQD